MRWGGLGMLTARGKGILNDSSVIGATGLGLRAQIAALCGAWPWLELKINQTETLWPAVGNGSHDAVRQPATVAGAGVPGPPARLVPRGCLAGSGKRGGVRVIYFNYAEDGTVLLVMMYAKNAREDVAAGDIQRAV